MKFATFVKDASDAAKMAFSEVDSAFGRTVDPDLKLYNSLTQEEFDAVAQERGVEEVARYILANEKKKLRGG